MLDDIGGWASDLWSDIKREAEDAYKSVLRRADVRYEDGSFSARIGEDNTRKMIVAFAAGALLVWLVNRK